MAAIQLFQLLKPRLGEQETEALINFVNVKAKENKEEMHDANLRTLATKQELWAVKEELKKDIFYFRMELKDDIAGLRTELKDDIAGLRTELKDDIAGLRTELKDDIARLVVKISDFKSDVIRWVFAMLMPLMLAIIGLYFKR